MGRLVGIDLGTTNSVVAAMEGPRPRILHSSEGGPQVRSMVSVKRRRSGEAEILVGDTAFDNWPMAPADTIVSIKRLMGRGVADPEVQRVKEWSQYRIVAPTDGTEDSVRVVLGGRDYSPIQVSAMILRKLKEDAELRVGEEVTHAVITVPAYFSHIQKLATRSAGVQAGLRVIQLLDEPTAAAVAYGMDAEEAGAKTILVFDLGGGTFDISVLVVSAGSFITLNLEGDMWLGGDNFDQALVEHAVRHLGREHPEVDPTATPRFMVELKRAAQRTKETLSTAKAADLIVPGLLQGSGGLIDLDIEVTREEFEGMIRPLVDRTVSLTEKALANANLTVDNVDYVLMAGNATMTPAVQRAMEDMFGGPKVLRKIHPKEAVALGAAIVAAVIGGRIVCGAADRADPTKECGEVNPPDAEVCQRCGTPLAPMEPVTGDEEPGPALGVLRPVAPFHYGARSANDAFTVFVRKGDPYPTGEPQMHEFQTGVPNARMISIPIYGGDDLVRASNNERQGEAFAILPSGLPKGAGVRIRLWLDADGVFRLSAHLQDGRDLQPLVVQKGEALDRAIATLERVEELLGTKSTHATPEELKGVERAREEVFTHMLAGREHDALAEVEGLEKVVGGLGSDVRKQAENLIGFTEFVTGRYRWAFDPARADRLDDLVEKTRAALVGDDPEILETRVGQLDRETDELPDAVTLLLGMRQVIAVRIRPYDPATAASLATELSQIEEAFASGDFAGGERRLAALVPKIEAAFESVPAPAGGLVCKNGHRYPGGRWCPVPGCGADAWELTKSG
ncbi:MAG: Hsp70 family protein [Actinobacteria bacterium]|nr:Hsp70 family protein [Actinomycetota bacterium]